jgi:hypothetical protein
MTVVNKLYIRLASALIWSNWILLLSTRVGRTVSKNRSQQFLYLLFPFPKFSSSATEIYDIDTETVAALSGVTTFGAGI